MATVKHDENLSPADAANTDFHPTNNPQVAEYGHKAAQAWDKSSKEGEKGNQLAIFALCQAFETEMFSAAIRDKKGEVEEAFFFDMEEYLTSTPTKADGTRDNKKMGARDAAIFNRVFGIEEGAITANLKNKLKSVLPAVRYLMLDCKLTADEVSLSSRNKLEVPYQTFVAEPDKEKDPNGHKLWKAMEDDTIELDGKEKRNVAELLRRARPEKSKGADGDSQGKSAEEKGKAFVASTRHVMATLQMLVKEPSEDEEESEEADVGFSPTIRADLFKLHALLTNYFEIDPLDEEEKHKLEEPEEEPKRTGTLDTRGSK